MSPRFDSVPGPGGGSGGLIEEGAEVVAGVVIETCPGAAPHLACRLGGVPGLEVVGGDGDRRLAAVWSAPSARELERTVELWLRSEPDVIGVFPTFIGRADEDGGAARGAARNGAFGSGKGDSRR